MEINKKLTRAVIYIKDIEIIMGIKRGAARRLYNKILGRFHKQPGQWVTYDEFCTVSGISEKKVLEYIKS